MELRASEASGLFRWDDVGSHSARTWMRDDLVESADESHASDVTDDWLQAEASTDMEDVEDGSIAGLLEGLDRIAHRIERAREEMEAEVEAAAQTWRGRANLHASSADANAGDEGGNAKATWDGFSAALMHSMPEGLAGASTNGSNPTSNLVALGQRLEKTLALHETYRVKSEETLSVLLTELKDLQVRLAASESGRQVLEASIPRIARSISQSYCTKDDESQDECESVCNRGGGPRWFERVVHIEDWKQVGLVQDLFYAISGVKGLIGKASSVGPFALLGLPYLSYLLTRK
uniref:Uncharacterized protein n=1 Tax=Picocystis salinarum TaxID=88271 RepID=A0A7S3U9I7_9CHLO